MQAGSRADEQSGGGEAEEGEGVGGGTQHGAASGDRLGESREWWGALLKKKKPNGKQGEVELTWRLRSIWKKQISIVNLK